MYIGSSLRGGITGTTNRQAFRYLIKDELIQIYFPMQFQDHNNLTVVSA